MLRAEDNKFLIESGAATPIGELLRRFWLPVLLSEELREPDGEPKKIVVMGEDLLAFRDSRGAVGVIEQYCPHRGANPRLGRNEDCRIRCVVPPRNKKNDDLIDRKLQRTKSYTGIKSVSEQDAAVQNSQGPIADRTREHLEPTDLGILHFRKQVMEAARALEHGKAPPHLRLQQRYAVRSGACVTHKAKDLPAVIVERFGDVAGFVGRPTTATAE
jgi:hypothetical protein